MREFRLTPWECASAAVAIVLFSGALAAVRLYGLLAGALDGCTCVTRDRGGAWCGRCGRWRVL